MPFQLMKGLIGMFYFRMARETCMTHWTIYETKLLNVNVSSMLEVIDSDVQCCIYKKKNLSALSSLIKCVTLSMVISFCSF